MVLTLEEVEQALKLARKHCKFWPSVQELCTFGQVEAREGSTGHVERRKAHQLTETRSEAVDALGTAEARKVLAHLGYDAEAHTHPAFQAPCPLTPEERRAELLAQVWQVLHESHDDPLSITKKESPMPTPIILFNGDTTGKRVVFPSGNHSAA
jgi:hypothetical protein